MTHQARLKEWIPFYRKTLTDGKPDTAYYCMVQSDRFQVQVADSMFLRGDYPSLIIDSIIHSDLLPKKEYKYSDLGFILLGKAIERITGQKLEDYVMQNFYRPLSVNLGYLPLERNRLWQIPPTENDTVFRHQLIHGYVHDQAAAMFGGVAGHAGLFGNSNDLAVLFQMLLQKGEYAGRTYIDSSTVRLFTSQQFPGNRRGLGFDKPQLIRNADGPACPSASGLSFGHTGFTGTYVWADPESELIIVFLSNRINPDAENNKITQMSIRTRIQQAVYNAIIDNKQK
jgi:CubicO group peptidase (beta-lactamase class C family)